MVCSVKVQRRAVWWRRALWRRGGGGDLIWMIGEFCLVCYPGEGIRQGGFWMA